MSKNQSISQPLPVGPGEADRSREINLSVTNGTERVSLGLSDQLQALSEGRAPKSQHVAMSPVEAVELAIALLNAAWNVNNGIHGSNGGASFNNKERAQHTLKNQQT